MSDDSECVRLLNHILERLDQLEAAKSSRPPLSYRDFLTLQKILPVIQQRFGIGGAFLSKDVADIVEMKPSEFGALLSRAEGQNLEGLKIIQTAKDHNAILWSLVEFED